MKTISLPWFLFWACIIGFTALAIGRYIERTAAMQNDVGNLKERVHQLEMRNVRSEERWGWVSRVGSRIPLLKNLFKSE